MINLDDRENENLLSVVDQMKIELLKDDPNLDMLHNLWRWCVRELTVPEILERFPGYRLSEMVSAIDNSLLRMLSERDLYIDN